MLHGRELRHAALLILFFLLLVLGCLVENPLDGGDGAYAEDAREQRAGGFLLRALLHGPAFWRAVPLTLPRDEFPYVTDAFAKEYVERVTPPQLADVEDNRTRMSDDFFEQLQLLRKPGESAALMARVMKAQIAVERVAARDAALAQRNSKSWKTRRSAVPTGQTAAATAPSSAKEYVQVRYTENVLYHGLSGGAGKGQRSGGGAGRRVPVSLAEDSVQLVPYPFVPYIQPEEETTAAAAATTAQNGKADDGAAPHAPPPSPQGVVVKIEKGDVRFTVPRRTTPHQPTYGWSHFYIALNLWKNEKVLPDLTEALVVFLEDEIKPFFDLASAVVVSIYANISPDRTAELIESVLIPRLHAVGVRRVYATTEGACLGYVERQPFHERIEWMACIRNKALEPLYEHEMGVFGAKEKFGDEPVVLFFNDIFFRPQDITTLLESRVESQISTEVRPHGWLDPYTPPPLSHRTSDPFPNVGQAAGTRFDMACGMDFYFTFYDTWVTRDRLGNAFEAQMPYSDDHATQRAFYRILRDDWRSRSSASSNAHGKREVRDDGGGDGGGVTGAATAGADKGGGKRPKQAGLPSPATASVPVKCCWNGVAAIRGSLFFADGKERLPYFLRASINRRRDKAKGDLTGMEGNNTANTTLQNTRDGEDAGSLPLLVKRSSGGVYDLLGSISDTLNATGLETYYTRVLARRVQWERAMWNNTRAEIAAVTGHPFYKPIVYDNTSSFSALLEAVVQQLGQQQPAHDWQTLALAFNLTAAAAAAAARTRMSNETAELIAALAAWHAQAEAVNLSAVPRSTALPISTGVVSGREDSAYYIARRPAIRFRHAFTPSYGATVSGMRPVRDDVCLSSECLLICQDVMQKTIRSHSRVPIILLNPHVRVAYDLEHFERVMTNRWFFDNPYVYWLWVLARRVQLWWWTGSTSGIAAAAAKSTPDTSVFAAAAEVRERGLATSATDDWMRDVGTPPTHGKPSNTTTANNATAKSRVSVWERIYYQATTRPLDIRDAYGAYMDSGMVDIPQLTQMACQRITAGSVSLAFGAFYPIFRVMQLLLVAVLLRWLCWRVQADIAGHPSSPEETWWSTAYHAIWYSTVAQRLRRCLESLALAGDAAYARHHGSRGSYTTAEPGGRFTVDDGETVYGAREMTNYGRGGAGSTTPPQPAVPVLHLQLRQYYRRKKLAATLGSCAYQTRTCLSTLARAVLWWTSALCCFRWWCGCRTPTAPPAPHCCAQTRWGRLWNRYVAVLPALSNDHATAAGRTRSPGQRRSSTPRDDVRGGEWESPSPQRRYSAQGLLRSPTSIAAMFGDHHQHPPRPHPLRGLSAAEDGFHRLGSGRGSGVRMTEEEEEGSRRSSPGRSPSSSPSAAVHFREAGNSREAQQQQYLRRKGPTSWPVNSSSAGASPFPSSPPPPPPQPPVPPYESQPPLTALTAPSAQERVVNVSFGGPYTAGNGYSSSGGGGGTAVLGNGAMPNVRPRTANARPAVTPSSSMLGRSPTTPVYGFPAGARSGEGNAGEAKVYNV